MRDHWQPWARAEVIVDPENSGRNFQPPKIGYRVTSRELISVVGQRMIRIAVEAGAPATYAEKNLIEDLKEVGCAMKRRRS